MTNRLAKETSPYLLQHAHNPVDWFPWGEEALSKARLEDRPIFLSIGYSACHWCHVMERESFENEEIAALLNERFVAIKVDREERPDIDSIYMEAVQLMTGHGGWPMSMFLTPEGVPFYGGTYFPPEDSRGMPGFKRVLAQLADAYRDRRQEIDDAGREIMESLNGALRTPPGEHGLSAEGLSAVAAKIAAGYDAVNGGFGGAPKFPPSMTLEFLMQTAAANAERGLREIVTTTLDKMARGGIYDQVGGGFHRYSVDARWLAPHFEKMLYDNALLARLYTHAWQWTKDPFYARIANEILGFVSREMSSPDGAFYSTLDADSEGEEGKFYVWSRSEILEILGAEEGRIFAALHDATERGNWEGKNILNVPREPQSVADDFGLSLDELMEISVRGKCTLYGRREQRVRPGRDEKVLSGWNGWMLAAFAEAALAFNSEMHRQTVRRNADFLIDRMLEGPKLFRSFKDGDRRIAGLLEDYAGVAWGLIAAFEATQQLRYLEAARMLADEIMSRFRDEERGGFFDTPVDHEKLITRPRDTFDNATPSGTSVAIDVLLKLALYFGDAEKHRVAVSAIESLWPVAQRYPSGFGFFLSAANWSASSPRELALTGNPDDGGFRELLAAAGAEYLPHRILVTSAAPALPLMEGRPAGTLQAYVCRGYACLEPTADPDRLRELLAL